MLVFLLCHKKGEGIHAQPIQDYTADPTVPPYNIRISTPSYATDRKQCFVGNTIVGSVL